MTFTPLRAFSVITLSLVALTAALGVTAAPAAHAAPSRAELENMIIQLQNQLAQAQSQIDTLSLTGDPASVTIQERLDSLQSELVRVVGELEEARYMNSRLQSELRSLRREIQLRDAEIADKLGLEPAFVLSEETSFDAPPGQPGGATPNSSGPNSAAQVFEPPLGQPVGVDDDAFASSSAPESDPSFFGDDPFAPERSAAVGQLGGPSAPLPDDSASALAYAKSLLVNGRIDEAAGAFAEFQQRFGSSPEAGEAFYWQGEVQIVRENYEEAKNYYIESLRAAPNGPRAPDAMIQLAAALQNMGLTSEACNTLASFPRQFPNASLSVRSKAERVRQSANCR